MSDQTIHKVFSIKVSDDFFYSTEVDEKVEWDELVDLVWKWLKDTYGDEIKGITLL